MAKLIAFRRPLELLEMAVLLLRVRPRLCVMVERFVCAVEVEDRVPVVIELLVS